MDNHATDIARNIRFLLHRQVAATVISILPTNVKTMRKGIPKTGSDRSKIPACPQLLINLDTAATDNKIATE